MKPTATLPSLALLALFALAPARAQVPSILNYQGRVTVGGTNLTTNAALFKFALVDSNGSTVYWRNDGSTAAGEPSSAVSVAVAQGLYSTLLGNTSLANMAAIPAGVFSNANVNLRVWFSAGGTNPFVQVAPDQRLGASGYALRAAVADNIASTNIDGNFAVTGTLTVGQLVGGTLSTSNAVLNSVSASNAFTITTGGTVAWFAGPQTTNNSQYSGEPYSGRNVLSGHSSNSVAAGVTGATIAGGGGVEIGRANGFNRVEANFGTVAGGFGNRAQGEFSFVGGGSDNTASGELGATVGGGERNTASGLHATVGGGQNNTASDSDATVGGGYLNTASASDATVGGGLGNTASDLYATVGGGDANTASGQRATVGGGERNTASGQRATVGGGRSNAATGAFATIPGGSNNVATNNAFAAGTSARATNTGAFVWADASTNTNFASTTNNQFLIRAAGGVGINTNNPGSNALLVNGKMLVTGQLISGNSNNASTNWATVGGGYQNTASGPYATVGGGYQNTASGSDATVGGGFVNTASGLRATVGGGSENTASGSWYATVGGGDANTASGSWATVGGGDANTASGSNATVGGGYTNTASGSFATVPGGVRAFATNSGAFVWSGDSSEDTGSFGNNTFTVRAEGGVRFYSANGAGTGVSLAAGSGTWTSLSDRNAKENFELVDGTAILAKVAAMPVMTWNYKTQKAGIRHIGPMAQDFKKAFGIGETDTGITTVDADGVALAAIQGLIEELKARDKTIEELKAKSAEFESKAAEMDALKSEMRTLRDQVQSALPPAPR